MNIKEAISVLNSSQDAVERRNAADVLINSNAYDSITIETLSKGLTDIDSGVKDICARALASIPKESADKAAWATVKYISSNDIELRNLACEILLKISEPAIPAVLSYLKDPDPHNRQFAVDIIGKIGDSSVCSHLVDLLEDENFNVRISSIEALGDLKALEYIDNLIEIYDSTEDLKPSIIDALGKIGSPQAQDFLIFRIKNEEDLFLKTACIDALAFIGEDLSICQELLGELRTTNEEVKIILLKAVFAIAYRNNLYLELPKDLRYIAINALFDDDSDIRAAGLIAMGDHFYIEDVPGLVSEVMFDNPETQQHILRNLVANSDSETITHFFKSYFKNTIPDSDAIDFLSYLHLVWDYTNQENSEVIIDVLMNLIFTTQKAYSSEVTEILYKLNSEFVIYKIREFLNSEISEEIEEALDIISDNNLQEFSEDLINLIEHSDSKYSDKASSIISKFENGGF